MKLGAFQNLIEDKGVERDVIVRIEASYVGSMKAREYDVVGCEQEGPSRGEHVGPAVLVLRERAPEGGEA